MLPRNLHPIRKINKAKANSLLHHQALHLQTWPQSQTHINTTLQMDLPQTTTTMPINKVTTEHLLHPRNKHNNSTNNSETNIPSNTPIAQGNAKHCSSV